MMSHRPSQRKTPKANTSSLHQSNTAYSTSYHTSAQEPTEKEKWRPWPASEMVGPFVGEISVVDFVEFLPEVSNAETPIVDFSRVSKGGGKEQKMYDPFVTAITESKVTLSFDLLDTSSKKDALGDIKPDLGLFSSDVEEEIAKSQSLSYMDLFVEIKPHKCQDAFAFPVNDEPIVKEQSESLRVKMTQASIEHLGRQTNYAGQLMAFQHRTHLFSISIIGPFARLIRWDRAGAIVSERFNYQDGSSNWLGEFLFRYANASQEARGFDSHTQRATDDELQGLAKAVESHLAKFNYPLHHQRDLQRTCEPSYPAYKIHIRDLESGKESAYIICRPFFEVPSLCSRATRGYLALAVETEELVFLKDTWRVDDGGVLSEAEVYRILGQYEEIGPYLPIILASGDSLLSNGQPQCTKTQDYAEGSQWAHESTGLRRRIRHRVVQKLALPLCMIRTDKELLEAIRRVLIVIKVAYHKAGILHRDISAGNVMLNLAFGGILNDWDHAINAKIDREGDSYRTGTWPFMSINILRFPKKVHTIHDDVESVFWVFYYNALHYFELASDTVTRGNVDLFDEQEVQVVQDGGKVVYQGGIMKLGFIAGSIMDDIKFNSSPITAALRWFAEDIKNYHSSRHGRPVAAASDYERYPTGGASKSAEEAAQEAAKNNAQKLEKVDGLIEIFDIVLKKTDWSIRLTHAVKDQFPRGSVLNAHRRVAEADLRNIEAQASVSTGTSQRRLTGDGRTSSMLPPDFIPAHQGSTSGAGSSTGPGTLSSLRSMAQAPSRPSTTPRSSSKRRIDDDSRQVKGESSAGRKRRKKMEQEGTHCIPSGRYMTRSRTKMARNQRMS